MDRNRRYSEEEVARILELATEVDRTGGTAPVSSAGMSLAELQEIGREVGIPAELIARAAASLETSPRRAQPSRVFLGTPIGVARTVDLPRRLTSEEWDRLVVDLRETFDARGRLAHQGAFRQWSNGNLQALLEPTDGGERLRLRTLKGDATATLGGGLALLSLSVIVLLVLALTGGLGEAAALKVPLMLAFIGGGMFTLGRITLPRWADARQLQMDGVAARLTEALGDVEEAERPDGD